jgi:hypothetical protein
VGVEGHGPAWHIVVRPLVAQQISPEVHMAALVHATPAPPPEPPLDPPLPEGLPLERPVLEPPLLDRDASAPAPPPLLPASLLVPPASTPFTSTWPPQSENPSKHEESAIENATALRDAFIRGGVLFLGIRSCHARVVRSRGPEALKRPPHLLALRLAVFASSTTRMKLTLVCGRVARVPSGMSALEHYAVVECWLGGS